MNLIQLSIVGIVCFFCILSIMLGAFKKSDENILSWTPLILIFLVTILFSWWTKDLALQWVLVEATTLFGAILISLSKTEKSIETAWKFLLLNSFGLGIAFIGILFVSYGTSDHASNGLNLESIIRKIPTHENLLVEAGVWLVVFGYSAKLGLFPNHFWVSDTYSESPSQISSILASYLPVTVALAIFPYLQMDKQYHSVHFSASSAFLVLAMISMFYSLFTLVQTNDLRRITSLIALFHSGSLAVILFLQPPMKVLLYALASNILVKTLLFSSMGILRIDLGSRSVNEYQEGRGLSRYSLILYLFAVAMAFIFPLSPFFVSDLIMIREAMMVYKYFILFVPILGVIVFVITLKKILPLFSVHNREFMEEEKEVLEFRLNITYMVIILNFLLGIYGLSQLWLGGI